ncbi:MAG: type II secretion system protein GspD [Planctomycetota bacterium]
MIKRIYTKTVLYSLLVILCLCQNFAQSKLVENDQRSNVDVGRENPFSQLSIRNRLSGPRVAGVSEITGLEINRPELFLETITLKFLDAKNLKTVIEALSSEYGRISTDTKSNSLIICDTVENLEMILAEIRRADKTPQQIMIEVVILDVQLNDDTEIGVNWDILSDQRYDIGYRQNFTTSRLGSTIENSTTIGNATAFNTTGLGGSLSIIDNTIRNIVHLIQQKRDVEILASPRVMTVSGQSASIEAVEELPYTEVADTSQGGAGALTSTEFKNVGVKLQVTAILVDANDILLTVDAEQNVTTGESDTEVPIVDTRRAHSTLLLKDGQVVVMGGLRRQEKTKDTDQIPILGDLPIIGELFKSTNTVVKNSELIVFLSPHIYKDEPIDAEAMAKFKEIKDRPMLSLPNDNDTEE